VARADRRITVQRVAIGLKYTTALKRIDHEFLGSCHDHRGEGSDVPRPVPLVQVLGISVSLIGVLVIVSGAPSSLSRFNSASTQLQLRGHHHLHQHGYLRRLRRLPAVAAVDSLVESAVRPGRCVERRDTAVSLLKQEAAKPST
jgi:hypothetical protein